MPSNDVNVTLLPLAKTAQKRWGQLYGSAESLAIAEFALQSDALVVVVAANTPDLLNLEAELGFYRQPGTPMQTFSDWETLTYDRVSPHQDIISQRIRTLYALPKQKNGILLITAAALMQRLPPRTFLEKHALIIHAGENLELEQFRERLVDAGYRNVAQVEERGEFAVRGSILDLYPVSSKLPLRVEFFDEEIDTIRTFDPDTQRGLDKATTIELLPAHEFPLNQTGIARFRKQFRNTFAAESKTSPLYRDVSDGIAPAGIEYYMPLFFEQTESLFEYLPTRAAFIATDGAIAAMHSFAQTVADRYEQLRHDIERPILTPDDLYGSADSIAAQLQREHFIQMQRFEIASKNRDVVNFSTTSPGLFPSDARSARPLGALEDFINHFVDQQGGRVLFVAESTGRREALLDQLVGNRLSAATVDSFAAFLASDRSICLTVAPLDNGLQLDAAGIAIITEMQLGSSRVGRRQRRRATRDSDAIIANLTDLNIGAPVVHIDNGVGRYQGLTIIELDGVEKEFLTIRYAGTGKLHVPVASLHLISRYSGADEDTAPLHHLGSDAWQKAKRKAAEKAYDVAAELLEIHARRAAKQGFQFPQQSDNYSAFSAAFPFEETPDQQSAIDAVIDDLRAVGFGKTEVAMRAAFVAVDGGKQVAVLVPTTLLARQHEQNFLDRFADWPVRIESISRFDSTREAKQILERLANGKIDIIIGTHKLLQKDIRYKNLGLVIIDEEHRFGVRHKEHMKALRSEVDILTLTATPIPRTLNMGLAGMRDLSIIATPPQHRHAIKTFVGEWSDVQIREACDRELSRGGQVYFLHNEVSTIENMADKLRQIVPNGRVEFAHGQMREAELEQVMVDFHRQRFNILVSTTIIESGIDIPTANTIIINRADKLGLAQLHQLRGRVGRSHHRAYAYLITPPKEAMTADAEKRLTAIESLEDLGVGFTLATHDLEIRGAGELLGEEQSGQIQAIGFTLYTELLQRAVAALKSGQLPDYDTPLAHGTEVDLGSPALLPEDYVPDIHQRLILYKRVANASDSAALRELKIEFIDRFGLLPPQTENLFDTMRVRLRCSALGIKRLEMNAKGGRIVFGPQPDIDPGIVIELIQKQPAIYRFDGGETLRVVRDFDAENDDRVDFFDNLLDRLAARAAA